jgi:hypothetical protein
MFDFDSKNKYIILTSKNISNVPKSVNFKDIKLENRSFGVVHGTSIGDGYYPYFTYKDKIGLLVGGKTYDAF